MDEQQEALATIWRIPDALWGQIEPVILSKDPPKRKGRKRTAGVGHTDPSVTQWVSVESLTR